MPDHCYLCWLASETPTTWWLDSGEEDELQNALACGAVGITTNPPLAYQAIRSCPDSWKEGLREASSGLKPVELAEMLTSRVVKTGAQALMPLYEQTAGEQGYICAQVNPSKAGDRESMMALAKRFHSWAPNVAVKLPATAAGLDVLEDCVAEGITVAATVSFSVPQVLEVAVRYQQGQARARQAGIKPAKCFPVIMIGRIDDYLREVAQDRRSAATESDIRQAGLAITKRALHLYEERGYGANLIVAALRGPHHMAGLAGGKLIMSIHPKIKKMILAPDMPRAIGIDTEIEPDVMERLMTIPEFVRAYEPDGLKPEEFITFGVTQRTLSQFIESGWALLESFKAS